MVVVQFFAADEDRPRHDIARGVGTLEVPIAPVVTDTVDDAGGKKGNAHHLQSPHGGAERAEQQDVEYREGSDAQHGVGSVEVQFEPIAGRAPAVLLKRLVGDGVTVVLGAPEEYGGKAVDLRAVGIVFGFGQDMVLAVNRRPDLGRHARRHP